jgi:methylmalonic aciduria homocystinuria type C protein
MKSSAKTFQEAASVCAQLLLQAGYDLVQPFSLPPLATERAALWREPWAEASLPHWAQNEAVQGLLIGNTRHLWAPFLDAVQRDPALADQAHPLDLYTARRVQESIEPLQSQTPGNAQVWLGYAHTLHPCPLPMTRLADACGLGRLGPAGLVVHPRYGPWIALRAVVLVRTGQELLLSAGEPHPCTGCSAPCAIQARRARGGAATRPHRDLDLPLGPVLPELSRRARLWLAVRDVCPLGVAHRYSPAQISYHYDKDRRQLMVK